MNTGFMIVLLLSLATSFNALAQGVAPMAALPPAVAEALARSSVPLENVSIMVKEPGAPRAVLAINADQALNPASVMKLFTTYAGLELLGPAYTWKTEVYAAGEVRGSTLKGDLVLKGGGDPKLTVEHFAALLKQLRQRGLRTIRGDLILDRAFFDVPAHDQAAFDGESLRAYNVGADALLLNFKTVRFFFAASADDRSATISPDVIPAQLDVVNRVRLVDGNCGDWQSRIVLDIQTLSPVRIRVVFTGNYPRSCGAQAWNISLLDHTRFVGGAFAGLWKELGGSWNGAVKVTATPADAKLLASMESAPLAEIVRDINKFSNNVMARQLFLTLSAEKSGIPGTMPRSAEIIKEWLARKRIAAPELVFENGSGLSRLERSSAATLSALLDAAWASSVMPEFISSMSLLGIDGTLRRRSRSEVVAGQAHIKTGTLNDAAAIAGYVRDVNGKRWSVVMLVNHPNAPQAQAAQDALLAWIYAGAITPVRPVPAEVPGTDVTPLPLPPQPLPPLLPALPPEPAPTSASRPGPAVPPLRLSQ